MPTYSLARRFSLAMFGHTCNIQHWGEHGAYSMWSLTVDDELVVKETDDFLDLLRQGIKHARAKKKA
jgi:hypothetical protein